MASAASGVATVSPLDILHQRAQELGLDLASKEFAEAMDRADSLARFRDQFLIPRNSDLMHVDPALVVASDPCIYMCGNSLGLQPKQTQVLVMEELNKWARRGVTGHHDDSPRPWVSIDETVTGLCAKVVGARPNEVAIMNTLTVNLHLLMVPFYRPTPTRFKILFEAKSFPSDFYAFKSQAEFHGYNPTDALLQVEPRPGQQCISDDDICRIIEEQGDSIAVVLLSGVQYYNGQFFDIPRITKLAHEKGCTVGFDLAHAAGNIALQLHDWDVDFACWCTYKYLNAGPGGIAGAFVHEKHGALEGRPRFAGWWGVDREKRFTMAHDLDYIPGVQGLQLSNPPVLQTVSLLASLQLFDEATMPALRAKSQLLTSYLEWLLVKHLNVVAAVEGKRTVEIITPEDPARRGAQLSLLFSELIKPVFDELEKRGIVCDMREPNVLRVAPTPMYNTFADAHNFVRLLIDSLVEVRKRQRPHHV
eukprot:m.146342 g.146342  ORF g.146342 m.146342 type:complete len:477 (+) comp16806_c0_seq2:44-1474(+)